MGIDDFTDNGKYDLGSAIQQAKTLCDMAFEASKVPRIYISDDYVEELADWLGILAKMEIKDAKNHQMRLKRHLESKRNDETTAKLWSVVASTLAKLVGTGGNQSLARESRMTEKQVDIAVNSILQIIMNRVKDLTILQQILTDLKLQSVSNAVIDIKHNNELGMSMALSEHNQ